MNTLKIKLSIFYLKFKLKQKPCLDFNFRNERFRMVGTNKNFWKELSNNRWEPDTFNILDHYLKCNMVYMDVGAWIGPTVCYAAKKADLVIAFEPDPYAFYILKENVRKNNLMNVRISNTAVSDSKNVLRMASFGNSLGDSQTSSLPGGIGKHFFIKTTSVNDISHNTSKIDFLKMDIEGGEFDLIPKMDDFFSKHHPIFYISFHAPYLEKNLRKNKLEKIHSILNKYYKVFKNERLEAIPNNTLLLEAACNGFFTLICES